MKYNPRFWISHKLHFVYESAWGEITQSYHIEWENHAVKFQTSITRLIEKSFKCVCKLCLREYTQTYAKRSVWVYLAA